MPGPYVGGVAVGALQSWNPNRLADFQKIANTHSTWVRAGFEWMYLEPIQGDWRFSTFDGIVADARACGMRVLAIMHTVPGWANSNAGDYGPTPGTAEIRNYAYVVSRRYLMQGVTDFELGNEVNLPHPGWATPSGTTYYNKFFLPMVQGIRQASSELGIPANVLLGSLAPTEWTGGQNPVTFLQQVYAAGAAGKFEALAWHPYTGGQNPATAVHMNGDVDALFQVMYDMADGSKKIWATEYGNPSGGDFSMTEAQQAADVTAALDVWYAKFAAGPLFYYCGKDTGTSATDREQHFGVIRYDGTLKPSHGTLTAKFKKNY